MILKYPTKPHWLSDDLESFVHVLNWLALRFHRHDITDSDDLMKHVHSHYESFRPTPGGFDVGGDGKHAAIMEGRPPVRLTDPAPNQFYEFLQRLTRLCQQHYTALYSSGKLRKYQVALPDGAAQVMEPRAKPLLGNSAIAIIKRRRAHDISPEARNDSTPSSTSHMAQGIPQDRSSTRFNDKPISVMNTPTPALVLDSHKEFLDAFYDAVEQEGWPADDKVSDQFVRDSSGTGQTKRSSTSNRRSQKTRSTFTSTKAASGSSLLYPMTRGTDGSSNVASGSSLRSERTLTSGHKRKASDNLEASDDLKAPASRSTKRTKLILSDNTTEPFPRSK